MREHERVFKFTLAVAVGVALASLTVWVVHSFVTHIASLVQ
jgi:hypothetical protein